MKVSPKRLTSLESEKEVKAGDGVNFNLPQVISNNVSLSSIRTQISNVNNRNNDNHNDNNAAKEPVNIVKIYNLHKTYLLGIEVDFDTIPN